MLKNYIKVAFRTLRRGDLHYFLNIAGLALGIAVILLIGGYVLGEINVNKDLRDVERTYVVHSKWSPENLGVFYTTLGPLAMTAKEDFPLHVEECYRYTLASATVSSTNGRIFREQLQIGDSSLIDMFGFELVYGNRSTLFDNEGIVVTETVARKYFNKTDAVGETLTLQTNAGKKVAYQVTGVLKDLRSNSVVNFANNAVHNEIFLPMSGLKHFMANADKDWTFKYMVSIIKIAPGISIDVVQQSLNKVVSSYAPPEFRNNLQCELVKLDDYYLKWGDSKMLKMVRTLSMVGLFILLLVTANFVGIMISGSSSRLREIGLRKLFGGIRRQLVAQFLIESVLISMMAMVVALGLYVVLRPPLQDLLGKPLTQIHEFDPAVFLGIVLLSVSAGFLAGLYPALRLSHFKIVNAVKGKLPAFGEGKFVRKALLSFQITIASFVLISSVFIAKQLDFIQHYDLGFDHQGLMVITSVPREWNEAGVSKLEVVRGSLLSDQDIVSASISYEVPDGNAGSRYNFRSKNNTELDMPLLGVDEHFAHTFGLTLLAGSFFHDENGTYISDRVVLNEKAVRSFGWTPEDAIGQQINSDELEIPLTIVGVVKNFHFYSLFESIEPISMVHIRDRFSYRYLSLRLKSQDTGSTVRRLQRKWLDLFPDAAFDYVFMDDKLKQFYSIEDRMYKSSKVAGLIIIFITVCGVIAFMSVSLVRRVKEIGIRRVHGASTISVISLFLKEFLWQYILGGALSCTFAYFFLRSWLNGFQYKTDLSIDTFLLTHLAVVLFISILIIGYSLRTVFINPIKSLRYE